MDFLCLFLKFYEKKYVLTTRTSACPFYTIQGEIIEVSKDPV